jgi:uncharacterized cysteine cluster protein YcgN (CxxCxxCC family)
MNSVERLAMVAALVDHAQWVLRRITWTPAECADRQLGEDMDALRDHLDKATGRTSTVMQQLRRING